MLFANRYSQFCKICKFVKFANLLSSRSCHSTTGRAVNVQFIVFDSQSIYEKSHPLVPRSYDEKNVMLDWMQWESFYPNKPNVFYLSVRVSSDFDEHCHRWCLRALISPDHQRVVTRGVSVMTQIEPNMYVKAVIKDKLVQLFLACGFLALHPMSRISFAESWQSHVLPIDSLQLNIVLLPLLMYMQH